MGHLLIRIHLIAELAGHRCIYFELTASPTCPATGHYSAFSN